MSLTRAELAAILEAFPMLNTTPHEINAQRVDGTIAAFPPCGLELRVTQTAEEFDPLVTNVDNVPISGAAKYEEPYFQPSGKRTLDDIHPALRVLVSDPPSFGYSFTFSNLALIPVMIVSMVAAASMPEWVPKEKILVPDSGPTAKRGANGQIEYVKRFMYGK